LRAERRRNCGRSDGFYNASTTGRRGHQNYIGMLAL
jgi:hypothetical protein